MALLDEDRYSCAVGHLRKVTGRHSGVWTAMRDAMDMAFVTAVTNDQDKDRGAENVLKAQGFKIVARGKNLNDRPLRFWVKVMHPNTPRARSTRSR